MNVLLQMILFASAACLFIYFVLIVSGEVSQHRSKHREEVAALQASVWALDREKDALQDDVDQKTEKLVVVQEDLSKKVRVSQLSKALSLYSFQTPVERFNLSKHSFVPPQNFSSA